MHWYVVHTKPRLEQRALLNLENQGYQCYLPLITREKLQRGRLAVQDEPLFPRYLFVYLDDAATGKSWVPIRSTIGVSRLVSFGNQPAQLDGQIVDALRQRQQGQGSAPKRLFEPGERLQISAGPFAGLDAIYQMADGDARVMVLIELLSKPTTLTLEPSSLRRAS